MKSVNLAIVGANGLVGRTMLEVLQERNFPINSLRLFGSERSEGKKIEYSGKEYIIENAKNASLDNIDIALFSAGSAASLEYAPIFAKAGAVVIDNSSAWRKDPQVPLVVPEVNPEDIALHKGIIANPNCNVIPLVVAMNPINRQYGLKRVIVSTYQSISGAGKQGIDKLKSEIAGIANNDKHQIFANTIFHPMEQSTDYTNEEVKLHTEPKKIMHLPELQISSLCVRLPFFACHCESVYIETEKSFEINEIRELLANSEGIVLQDDLANQEYPTPRRIEGKDEVYVGRIRRDETVENGLAMWVVSDNVRKGAATNAIQIAEKFLK